MPRLVMTLCAAAWLLTAAGGWAVEPAEELKQLHGTWQPVSAAVGDKPLPAETLAHIRLVIEDGRYTATVGESVDGGQLKIDPRQSPKAMDLVSQEGSEAGKAVLAIYELEGDRLTICYSLEEGMRPTELKTGGSMQRVLVRYERKRLAAGQQPMVR